MVTEAVEVTDEVDEVDEVTTLEPVKEEVLTAALDNPLVTEIMKRKFSNMTMWTYKKWFS